MITDELRQCIDMHEEPFLGTAMADYIRGIADRIDEEHVRQQEDLIDETLGGLIKMTDEKMAENGWVRLPKDADGEYIHIGDVMDSDHLEDGTVDGIQYFKSMQNMRMLIAVRPHNWDTPTWYDPEEYRHHHEPTVEDVLREFSCVLMGKREFDGDVAEAVAEYAQKLQLREES